MIDIVYQAFNTKWQMFNIANTEWPSQLNMLDN